MIELLLIEDVENLGKRGDKVRVKAGFARNHLIPLRYAVQANEDNLKMVEKRRVAWLAEEAKLIEELQELAGHIAKLDLTIVAKATEQGNLYGSVTAKDVADAAAESGVSFDTKCVRMESDLREVGDYEVPVRLHDQVNVSIPVRIRMEGNEDWVPGETGEAEASEQAAPEDEAPASEPPSTDDAPPAE